MELSSNHSKLAAFPLWSGGFVMSSVWLKTSTHSSQNCIVEHGQHRPMKTISILAKSRWALRTIINSVYTSMKNKRARFKIIFMRPVNYVRLFPCWNWVLTLTKRLPLLKPRPFYSNGQSKLYAKKNEGYGSLRGWVPSGFFLRLQLEMSRTSSVDNYGFFPPSSLHSKTLSLTHMAPKLCETYGVC